MTRQIRNLMMPLKEKGLMEGIMIHALRALRHNSDLLMCTMDVFIKEPSLDWKVNLFWWSCIHVVITLLLGTALLIGTNTVLDNSVFTLIF